jgi:N-acetylneuraminic acid mutarotase
MQPHLIQDFAKLCLLTAALVAMPLIAAAAAPRPMTLEDRIEAQRAIEQVYWRHRIWPKENPEPKPALSQVMPDASLRAKVDDYLRKSNALERYWGQPVTADQLQAEMDRMSRGSKDPSMLRELFHALGDDPAVIAETLARQTLVDRLTRTRQGAGERFDEWWETARVGLSTSVDPESARYELPAALATTCTNDTWAPTNLGALGVQAQQTAVWTGSEMILWGGANATFRPVRYSPATDTWTTVSTGTNAPTRRVLHTAVWTGTRMIVWGGFGNSPHATGGRYDPITDTWLPTSTGAGCPSPRYDHTAVWTGSLMIVWGGNGGTGASDPLNTGGRYDPSTDSWSQTSTGAGCPSARDSHRAVWTGSLMIVWGGYGGGALNSGGRYDPASDSWSATSIGANVPVARSFHTAVWTGSLMIVWGGSGGTYQNTGGRYNPSTDTWSPTSTGANVPAARDNHTAVWTGTEMIVWGGYTNLSGVRGDGARYNPGTDSWSPVSSGANVPTARKLHSAVWTGTDMVVWGGTDGFSQTNTGGRYRPATDRWLPTPTAIDVPAPRQAHTGVWTGAEMIVWGGANGAYLNSGGRYSPATDSWSLTSMGANLPASRLGHSAVWTGTEMIVWGGWRETGGSYENTGGRYNPSSDSWTPTSTGGSCPAAREDHTAVWTGTQMIVWGGFNGAPLSTGGRYAPASNSWSTVSTGANVPAARYAHVAVWTGTQMIVWGGTPGFLTTGGRYTPASDTWLPTSTGAGVPSGSFESTVVWTGSQMIVWGGYNGSQQNTGGRYDPVGDTWTATSTGTNVPSPRRAHNAVWSGSEMLVWGGYDGVELGTGGRYDPSSDSWLTISTGTGVPDARRLHSGVWTGTEMIVWGGNDGSPMDSGGRYCGCVSVTTYHRDADGDGFGASGDVSDACTGSVPPGYVIDASDCDDGNAQVHPGAAEVNDGLDNQCPGDPGFGSVDEVSSNLRFGLPLNNKTVLSWTAQAGATRYDLARSPYRDFHAGCRISSITSAALGDGTVPPPDGVFYYLVRAAAPWSGSWGARSSGVARTVCAGCDSSADQCDDGNPCSAESCAGTTCVIGSPTCDDGNPCTDDACNAGMGCSHVNNTNGCNDGSSCTTDVCQGGVCVGSVPGQANHLVISQIQIMGGTADDDFVELYNPTTAPVPLSGLSLQYKSNAGSTWNVHLLGGGVATAVPAHGWLLVARPAYDGAVPADETLSFSLVDSIAQVILASVTTSFSGCPGGSSMVVLDRVGWGSANCGEGSSPPSPGTNNSILRKPGGACGNGTDTNANFGDFITQVPSTPRNSLSPPQP